MDEDDDGGSSGSSTRLNNDESPITHHFGTVPSLCPIVIGGFPVPLSVPGPILFVLHPRENGVTETTISNSSQYRCFSN